MSSRSGIATALLAAACISCASVRVTSEPPERFAGYRSWDWLPATVDARAPADPELEWLVRRSVERELAARGYRRASWLAPDFYVSCEIELVRVIEVHTETNAPQTLFSLSHSPSYVVSDIERRPRVFELVTVRLDASDATGGQAIWSGVETKRFRRSFTPHAHDVIREILGHFPARRWSATGMMASAEDLE